MNGKIVLLLGTLGIGAVGVIVLYVLTTIANNTMTQTSNLTETAHYKAAEIYKLIETPSIYQKGLVNYKIRCSKCHGLNLEGARKGPSLRKDINTHDNFNDILTKIKNGNPKKGMPAWNTRLQEEELVALSTYLYIENQKN